MKCLYVSDLHYALKQFDWVINIADQFDIVILAGDHLDISSIVDVNVQIIVVLKYLKRLSEKTRVIVCSGNHDLDARNEAGEKYAKWLFKAQQSDVHTDGSHVVVKDSLFTICPWWDGPMTREQVGLQLAADAKIARDRWIWVYHSPPDNSPTSWVGKRHIGDTDLLVWIEKYKPDMVLTGHIHQSPFAKGGSWVDRIGTTWVFNPGRQMGPYPTHIIFDVNRQSALWLSLDDAQQVNLKEPIQRPIPSLTELPAWIR